jgi:hypothetical protein
MDRSFTIEAIYNSNGNKIRYDGGRYISKTPSGAARKAFSQASRHMRKFGKLSLDIHIRETTQNSHHKTYIYKVRRVRQDIEVERDGVIIQYKYKTKIRAL